MNINYMNARKNTPMAVSRSRASGMSTFEKCPTRQSARDRFSLLSYFLYYRQKNKFFFYLSFIFSSYLSIFYTFLILFSLLSFLLSSSCLHGSDQDRRVPDYVFKIGVSADTPDTPLDTAMNPPMYGKHDISPKNFKNSQTS
jgi:hypothetical protein